MLRSIDMKPLLLLLLCLASSSLFAGDASAQIDAVTVLDSGRLLVSSDRRVVATEEFEYALQADSITITSTAFRPARASDGSRSDSSRVQKTMAMVVSSSDFGLRSYLSNIRSDGHVAVRGVIPGDTAMTVYSERDGRGDAERLSQPPGRLFVMDPGLFVLFDVVCHSLKGKSFTRRPVQLVVLAEPAVTVEAIMSVVGDEVLSWGGRRVPVRRMLLTDPTGEFTVWVDSESRMLKLEHAASRLVVVREAPVAAKPAPAARKPRAGK